MNMLVSLNNSEKISNNLPPLLVNILDDGTILIEWIFPDYRISFAIEKDLKNSNWCLITNDKFNEKIVSELFDPMIPSPLPYLIDFALKNS